MLQCPGHLPQEVRGLRLGAALISLAEHEVEHVSALAELGDQVHEAVVLEDLKEPQGVGVVHKLHHADLAIEVLYVSDVGLPDLLHGSGPLATALQLRGSDEAEGPVADLGAHAVPVVDLRRVVRGAMVPDHLREARGAEGAGAHGGVRGERRTRPLRAAENLRAAGGLRLLLGPHGSLLHQREAVQRARCRGLEADLGRAHGEADGAVQDGDAAGLSEVL
mmetsp:Transcript_56362/g.113093  ORF Transcript_56362/g.113093 Transcript_56362/m.113093 type:complete len:221 (-) Transcript_56362:451-1113(-)